MVQINFAKREIHFKIVFYGPCMAGRTTNMEIIYKKTPEPNREEITSVATENDRTLFLNIVPSNIGSFFGLKIKIRFFAVPGAIFYNSTKRLVLQGANGIFFVADSQKKKLQDNQESLQNLEENLACYDISMDEIPVVIQWNKRDLADILSIEELEKKVNVYNFPSFESVAIRGEGVFPALRKLTSMVMENEEKKLKK